jgi:hypothetical protein
MSAEPVVMLSPDGREFKKYPQTTLDARLTVTAYRNVRSPESQNAPRYKEKVDSMQSIFATIESNAGLPKGSMFIRVEDSAGALTGAWHYWNLLVEGAGGIKAEVYSDKSAEGKENKFDAMVNRAQAAAATFSF